MAMIINVAMIITMALVKIDARPLSKSTDQ